MNGRPFDDETAGTRGKTALQYREGVDPHQRFISTVQRMEVRRSVVVEIHAYQYFGQNSGRPVSDRAIVTKVLVIGAGFFQAMPLG